jgi:hypothetical protein
MSYLIGRVNRTVTAKAAQCCRCKFPATDEFGDFEEYRPHDNWEIRKQDHSNPGFATFLQCVGCGYQLARTYWNDKKDGEYIFVDYEADLVEQL